MEFGIVLGGFGGIGGFGGVLGGFGVVDEVFGASAESSVDMALIFGNPPVPSLSPITAIDSNRGNSSTSSPFPGLNPSIPWDMVSLRIKFLHRICSSSLLFCTGTW